MAKKMTSSKKKMPMKMMAKRGSPAAKVPNGSEWGEKGFGGGKLMDRGKKR